MKKIVGFAIAGLVISYPFLVFWGINHLSLKTIGWLFLAVIILRTIIYKNQLKQWLPILICIVFSTILLNISNDPFYLRLNPVIISSAIFCTFTYSLIKPPSMIEVFARLQDKNLPENAIPYCRKITIIWSIFLFLNSSIALYTALKADIKLWAVYNGFISYILMGILFAGEYLYRKIILTSKLEKN